MDKSLRLRFRGYCSCGQFLEHEMKKRKPVEAKMVCLRVNFTVSRINSACRKVSQSGQTICSSCLLICLRQTVACLPIRWCGYGHKLKGAWRCFGFWSAHREDWARHRNTFINLDRSSKLMWPREQLLTRIKPWFYCAMATPAITLPVFLSGCATSEVATPIGTRNAYR